MAKSTAASPGVSDVHERTVKIDGSGWSKEMLPCRGKREQLESSSRPSH